MYYLSVIKKIKVTYQCISADEKGKRKKTRTVDSYLLFLSIWVNWQIYIAIVKWQSTFHQAVLKVRIYQ